MEDWKNHVDPIRNSSYVSFLRGHHSGPGTNLVVILGFSKLFASYNQAVTRHWSSQLAKLSQPL